MHVMAFNGSARKTWNTATLLGKVLEGAASQGAHTDLVHLYDLKYTGCRSCFACKTKGGKSYGRCAAQDDLTPILEQVTHADAIVLGSPVYYGTVSGEMKSFLERLAFPYWTYTDPPQSLFPKRIPTGLIYTMNITEELAKDAGYGIHFAVNERVLRIVFGSSETLLSYDTYQFDDYTAMIATRFDAKGKARRRKEVFPHDCEKAFAMGARLATARTND